LLPAEFVLKPELLLVPGLLLPPVPEELLEPLPVPPTDESERLVLVLPRPEPLRKLPLLFVLEVPDVPLLDPWEGLVEVPEGFRLPLVP